MHACVHPIGYRALLDIVTIDVLVLTSGAVSQLPADHRRIVGTPRVITDSAPDRVQADLHSALVCGRSSNESQISAGTACVCKTTTTTTTTTITTTTTTTTAINNNNNNKIKH